MVAEGRMIYKYTKMQLLVVEISSFATQADYSVYHEPPSQYNLLSILPIFSLSQINVDISRSYPNFPEIPGSHADT